MKLGNKKIDWTRLFACVAFATVVVICMDDRSRNGWTKK